jgi:hypothetical protein
MSTLETLEQLAKKLERQLNADPVYREWLAVQKTIAELRGVPAPMQSREPASGVAYSTRPTRGDRVTSITATCRALDEAGRPLSTRDLLDVLPKYGFKLGGKKEPASALSSLLSKPGKRGPLRSVWIDNKPLWWFSNRPIPALERTQKRRGAS